MESKRTPSRQARVSIDQLREFSSRILNGEEIKSLIDQYPQDKRLMSVLLQKAEFPQHHVMAVLSKMYAVELLRIAQGPRTAPFVRQRAELAFVEKFRQMQKGEQITALKLMAPRQLKQFAHLGDQQLLSAILNNPRCTEEVVMELFRKKAPGIALYMAVLQSRWIRNLMVADLLSRDPQTPVRVMLAIVPLLPQGTLRRILQSPALHGNVRTAAEKKLKVR